MGYVSQAKHLPDWMTGEECLDFARSFRPKWDQPGARALAKRFGLPLRQRVHTLSRGHYVRLQTCVALGHHPELILLDEPTSGLDPDGRRELLAILIEEIESAGAAVVISSHLVEDLERMADTIAIFDTGRIVACGAPDDLQRMRTSIAISTRSDSGLDATTLPRVPGLVEWRRDGATTLAITGEPEDALAYLQAHGLEAAMSTVPSLQQVFLDSIHSGQKTDLEEVQLDRHNRP
jgi:ABC-2 type transport system ATP-binding protein